MKDVSQKALESGANKVILVKRWKGGIGSITLDSLPFNYGKSVTLFISGVKTQLELGKRTVIRDGLVITFEQNLSKTVKNLAEVFSNFLNVPLIEEKEGLHECYKASAHFTGFRNDETKIAFTMPPMVKEIGPILIVKSIRENNHGEEIH